MNNDFERMNRTPSVPSPVGHADDEEDWEAGDDDSIANKLRPSAPAFVPRPPPLLAPPLKGQKDEEDEWSEPRRPVTNRQLWDTANKAPVPMLAPSPTYGSLPPSQVKILRRDPTAQPKKSPGPSTSTQKTLTEREEQYRLARERIFGKEGSPSSNPTISTGGGSGSGDRGSRASPTTREGRDRGITGQNQNLGDDAFRLVPSQVRQSPVTSREGTPVGGNSQRRKEEGKGVLRQPKGPGEGGGFGR